MSPPDNPVSPSPPLISPSTSHLRILILEPSPPSIKSPFPSSIGQYQFQPQPQSQTPSLIPPLLHALIGDFLTTPTPLLSRANDNGSSGGRTERISYAGYTTHPPLRITTRYFDCRVGLWCDEVPLPSLLPRRGKAMPESEEEGGVGVKIGGEKRKEDDLAALMEDDEEGATTQTWLAQMLSPASDAVEVRSVIGAIVLALPVRETLVEDSSLVAAAPDPFTQLDDDNDGMQQHHYHHRQRQTSRSWRLRDEYLDIVEAVNTLRSTIEDERVRAGAEGDVGTAVVLQGEIPGTSTTRGRGCAKASRNLRDDGSEDDDDGDGDGNPADALVEAVEEQLLTDRAILGWDIIAWDGVSPTTVETLAPSMKVRKTGSHQTDILRKASTKGAAKEEQRNIYGERTGLARLNELLHNVDWSATPSPSQRRRNHRGENAEEEEEENDDDDDDNDEKEDPDPHLDLDPDFLLSPTHSKATILTRRRRRADSSDLGSAYPHRDEDGSEIEDEAAEDEDEEEDEAAQVEQLQSLLQQAMVMREAGVEAVPRRERDRFARRLMGL